MAIAIIIGCTLLGFGCLAYALRPERTPRQSTQKPASGAHFIDLTAEMPMIRLEGRHRAAP